MALLRITIGNVTASKTIDDTKATAVTTAIYNNIVLPGWREGVPLPNTAQERLQAVVEWLALDMRDTARDVRRRELEALHRVDDATELSAIDV
jgi:hypothetical protein